MISRLLQMLAGVVVASSVTAAMAQVVTGPTAPGVDDSVVLKNRSLRNTTFSFQTPIFPVQVSATGFNPVDSPIMLNCPADTPGRCLFEADMSIQVGSASSATTAQICMAVDGEFVNGEGFCPSSNGVPKTGWMFAKFTQALVVSTGQHTVQTFIKTGANAFRGNYTIDYRVYKAN